MNTAWQTFFVPTSPDDKGMKQSMIIYAINPKCFTKDKPLENEASSVYVVVSAPSLAYIDVINGLLVLCALIDKHVNDNHYVSLGAYIDDAIMIEGKLIYDRLYKSNGGINNANFT